LDRDTLPVGLTTALGADVTFALDGLTVLIAAAAIARIAVASHVVAMGLTFDRCVLAPRAPSLEVAGE
jgi:hypothetical protein